VGFLSRISVRLLLFNILLVFLPAAAFLYLGVFESQLLKAQERSMVQQGRLLAAALGGQGDLEAAEAEALLRRLELRTEARLRIYDRQGALLADSATLGPKAVPADSYSYSSDPVPRTRDRVLYKIGAALYRLYQEVRDFTEPDRGRVDRSPDLPYPPEVGAALAGRYGAATRQTGRGPVSLTLSSALPVRSGEQVVGAVQVSQSTARILRELAEVRFDIFKVILASLAAAAVLSLLLSTTIARPLRRLRDEANALLDRRGRLRGTFKGSRKRDEIGDLARALERLTARLEEHQRSLEAFAADVSHEFKNPLASIRAATEMLGEVEDEQDRSRFLALVQREVSRLERLLSGVREVTEIDARLEAEGAEPVDLAALLREVIDGFGRRAGPRVEIALRTSPEPVAVQASAERLTQVFENLLDNALGFSPAGGRVTFSLERENGAVLVRVDDEGPGIPEPNLPRLFDRFFSYRPGEPGARNGHTGLGLAIVKAIVEGYGGSVTAANRLEGGARFEVRLPNQS
jgi:two-component system, OmpR family, sensor histidine kinase ChvG